eukprot:gene6814-10979_t
MGYEKEEEVLKKIEKLFIEEKYTEALKLFSESVEDKTEKFYNKKAECFYLLQKYPESIDASNFALDYDSKNELAFLRKAMCLFMMEEFENSKLILEKGIKNTLEYEKEFKRWLRKCQIEIDLKNQTKPVEKPKIRNNWYQTDTSVVISLIVKNKKKEDTNFQFTNNSMFIDVLNDENSNERLTSEFNFFEEIKPENPKITFYKSKIEVSLEKKNQNIQWTTLEKGKEDEPKFDPKKYVSVTKKKDWNELNNVFKEEDEKEIPKGDAAMNALFQKIYAGGSDETKRAMMKSFVESKGTVLSTNWNEVGSKKIECTPPTGMQEFK